MIAARPQAILNLLALSVQEGFATLTESPHWLLLRSAEILELPVQERIRLVELIWESIAAVPEAVEVTPEIKTELEERLKEFEANPEAGYSWEQVKSRLRNATWRSA